MKRINSLQNVAFAHITLSNRNDREHTPERLYNAEIQQTGPVEGQRVPALLLKRKPMEKEESNVKPDEKGFVYETLQGNSRFWNLSNMGARGVIDPKTCKRDDKGNIIPGTGKPFSTLEAYVVEDASPEEVEMLLNDNTGQKLNDLEISRGLMRAYQTYGSERATLTAKYGLLLQSWPAEGKALVDLNKAIEAFPPSLSESQKNEQIRELHLARWHGRWLTTKAAYQSATVVKEAYENKLRGKQNWPKDPEIKALYTLYNQDVDDRTGANKDGKINPDNPGPRFMEKWNEIMRAVKTAAEAGTDKVRATNMLTSEQIRNGLRLIGPRSLQLVVFWVQQKLSGEAFADFVKVQSDFENGKLDRPKYDAILDTYFAKMASEPAPAATTTTGTPTPNGQKQLPDNAEVVDAELVTSK